MSHRDSHINSILLKLFTNIHMRILSFLMSNRHSTYTKDVITVMEWGLWWRMKQEVPQVAYVEHMKHHLQLKTADACKSKKIYGFGKMLHVIKFCGVTRSHYKHTDETVHLYYRVRTFYRYFTTKWQRPNASDRGTCWTQNDDRIVTSSEHITHTSSLHSTSSTEAVKTCVCLPPVERLWHNYSSSTVRSSDNSFNRIWIKIKNTA